MTDRTHPDSGRATGAAHIIRYALELGLLWIDGSGRDKVREALDALNSLEAQLEAIGAGGVSGPLVGRAAPKAAPAPLSDDDVRDAAFEAVRKKLCALPRFSFLSDRFGVRRVLDKSGSWIAFDAAHELFDPVAVDAAIAAQGGRDAG